MDREMELDEGAFFTARYQTRLPDLPTEEFRINDHGVVAIRAGMKDAAVREPSARVAGVDARAPWFFHANLMLTTYFHRHCEERHDESRALGAFVQ
jgi:hypothetical protein